MANARNDNHSQPANSALESRHNSKQAALVLRGILQGIVADNKLDRQEIVFLNSWLQSRQAVDNEDVRDLTELVNDVLADGIVSTDELQELYILIDDVIVYGDQPQRETDESIQVLLGLLTGIASDGKITDREILSLRKWLSKNGHIISSASEDEVFARLAEFCESGVVDVDEVNELLVDLKKFSDEHE